MTINAIIKEYLNEKGIKLADLAKKTGISSQNLSRILSSNDLKVSQLFSISEALSLPYDYFIFCYINQYENITECEQTIKALYLENEKLKETIITLQKKLIDYFESLAE